MCIKIVELVFESIPESVLQASILMISETQDVTMLSIFSVASSMLATGILVTDLNLTMEASAMRRQQTPGVHPVYGYIRASQGGKLVLACTMCVVCMVQIRSHRNTLFSSPLNTTTDYLRSFHPCGLLQVHVRVPGQHTFRVQCAARHPAAGVDHGPGGGRVLGARGD